MENPYLTMMEVHVFKTSTGFCTVELDLGQKQTKNIGKES